MNRLATFVRAITPPLLAVLLAGCVSQEGLNTRASLLDANTLTAQKSFAGTRTSPDGWPDQRWWTRFRDSQLDRLIDEALAGSPAMRVARARVDKALAQVDTAASAQRLQVNAGVDSSRQLFSENFIYPPPFGGTWWWQNQLALNFNYEFDFWGKNRAAYESTLGGSRAAQADAFAASLLLSTSVARAYVQLERSFEQRDIAVAMLAQREHLLELARQRLKAGLDSRVELKQAEIGIPAARDEIARLDETIQLNRNQLAALVGAGPDRGLTIARPASLAPAGIVLPAALPADLIGRRADVVAQRWRVEAAIQDRKNAQSQFYPNINLVAFIGLQSLGFTKLFESSSEIVGIGPAIRLPLFDGGRLRANLAGRNADYDLAVEQYNQTLIDAVHDVVDQLASLRAIEVQQREITAGLAYANEARALAEERYRTGLASYIPVLGADAQVLAQQGLAAELRARQLDVSINLVRALGGGYGDAPAPDSHAALPPAS
jgi:NodT family efflux transporter outer membrane factor (OMF) lipoprotein